MSLRALSALGLTTLTTIGACSLANAPGDVVPKDDDGSGGAGAQGGGPTTSSSSGTGGSTLCQDAADCTTLTDACHVGACTNGRCVPEPANEGGPCDDENTCTENDACAADGSCTGTDIVCPTPTDPCMVATCDPAGGCGEGPGNDGATCDDANGCTGDGTCANGVCTGAANTCNGSTPCGFQYCDQKVCKVNPLNEGQPCDTMNTCAMSTCVMGVCTGVPANDGQPCDDGQFCTFNETCAAGVCTAPAGDPCPVDTTCGAWTCNEATDSCDVTPQNEGQACNDGSVCTGMDKCTAGTCAGTLVPQIYFQDNFANNSKGWVLGPEWQIGSATASCCSSVQETSDPDLDHTPTDDNGVAGVVIGGNANPVVHGYYYLESPPFNTANAPQSVILGFYRWLNSDYDPYMHNRIEVWNGSSWVVIWQSGGPPVIQDSPPNGIGWTYVQHDITAYKNAAMRVRFGFDITQSGVFVIGSWNIDDVLVASLGCP
jgi:hypothetical protein